MKTMPRPKSNQDALNNVIEWFLVQKHPQSIHKTSGCLYRNNEGTNGCAIGCQLPDKLYQGQEDLNVEDLCLLRSDIEKYFNKVDLEFLQDLQTTHDNVLIGTNFHKEFAADLKSLAEEYRLKWPKDLYYGQI